MEKACIFVADDDDCFLELMRDLLEEEQDYAVITLNESENVYEEIVSSQPDLVILDVIMHRKYNGWDVLSRLKLNPITSHLPVIICSGDSNLQRDSQELLRSSGYLVLEKPFNIDDLFSMADQALSKSHAISA